MHSPACTASSSSASAMPSTAWAVCLCAQWCGTCREYRPVFDALAQKYPGVRFVWLDVEDEADVAGDYDVETFPSLLVADGAGVQFLGPVLPQASVLERLLQRLGDAPVVPAALAHDTEAAALLARIQQAYGVPGGGGAGA